MRKHCRIAPLANGARSTFTRMVLVTQLRLSPCHARRTASSAGWLRSAHGSRRRQAAVAAACQRCRVRSSAAPTVAASGPCLAREASHCSVEPTRDMAAGTP